MDLQVSLTQAFAVNYPHEAAAALEQHSSEEAARVLEFLSLKSAAGVLMRMAPGPALRVVEHLETERATGIFSQLSFETALLFLRRMTPALRAAIIGKMPEELSKSVNLAIGFPPGTAGALMDPRMLVISADLTVKEALDAIRRDVEHAHYNVYVVDRNHKLIGVLNLREMMQAGPKEGVEAVMHSSPHRLRADANSHKIIGHPGWRELYSLPVVDEDDRYLGAIRFRTLRRLERELQSAGSDAGVVTVRALGDLFWTGIGGAIGAVASTIAPRMGTGLDKYDDGPSGEPDIKDADSERFQNKKGATNGKIEE
jgi:Mg/Co/Ni transporter MgtE